MEDEDCLLCEVNNPSVTAQYVLGVLKEVNPCVRVVSTARTVNSVMYHSNLLFVRFPRALREVRNELLTREFDEFGFVVREVNRAMEEGRTVMVFGFPRRRHDSEYRAFFKDDGDVALMAHATADGRVIVTVTIADADGVKRFVEMYDGAIVAGERLTTMVIRPSGGSIYYEATAAGACEVLAACEDFRMLYYDSVYMCWSGSAIAMCGAIAEAAERNPDISEYDCPRIAGPFELVIDYLRGSTIQINDGNCVFLSVMGRALDIAGLVKTTERFISRSTSLDAQLVILRDLHEYDIERSDMVDRVAVKLTGHVLMTNVTFWSYPVELIETLISSPAFRRDEEGVLLSHIRSLKHINPMKYNRLIGQLRLERLDRADLLGILTDRSIDLNRLRNSVIQLSPRLKFTERPGSRK